ncbi:hypothetical protein L1D15_16055 [Vibrio sp. Isolate25]|uniref:hypothetical protein n=1 Tax=Vibrio TaxID=662 RepID=UPI001EFD05B5|nr:MULTISPECIES: hypothetical protein [Vibrio]MCG9598236.1 hypothetical protein [Vibrio sp. Isolate25]MCG9679407.1 hypothetical protein [Vibrio sp. Isolate24]
MDLADDLIKIFSPSYRAKLAIGRDVDHCVLDSNKYKLLVEKIKRLRESKWISAQYVNENWNGKVTIAVVIVQVITPKLVTVQIVISN